MSTTEISDAIGRTDNAYSYLALLSQTSRHAVSKLMTELTAEIGDGLWPMSNDSLHITLCELIQPKPYSLDKQVLFDAHAAKYKQLPAEIMKNFQPITVQFDKIVVSPQAITIQGSDDGSFDRIRQQMVEKLIFPEETRRPPDIIHSTIARFSKAIDLDRVEMIVKNHTFEQSERITEFYLTNCTVPPLEKFEILETFSLSR